MPVHRHAATVIAALAALAALPAGQAQQPKPLNLRPRPQIVSYRPVGLMLTAQTRVLLPKDGPAYVAAAAAVLVQELKAAFGVEPTIVPQERLTPQRGDIVVGPHWAIRPEWEEPLPMGLVRPASDEGYNLLIDERNCAVMGNSQRACFLGLQTLIQIARQCQRGTDGTAQLPGVFVSDWPAHPWRTLQLHLAHTGSPYDRGEHVYRIVTKADILERAIRLAAHHKMTGLVIDVESGMTYDRHPENFTTGITRNDKPRIRAAVDLARSLGLELVPKSNSSSGHDGWVIPYAFAAPSTDLYVEEMHDLYDEIIETFRPAHFHVGLDEDTFPDMDGHPLRDVALHKKILLADYEFLRRRGVTMLMWNDGVTQLGNDLTGIPRDIIVLPWMYGGWDFTGAKHHIEQGFRILCSPWSCWHVENDQFFSLYATSLKSDKFLGMAGTFWYTVAPDGELDYRRCLVKAADAFWDPAQAGDFPNEKEYYAPAFAGLPGDALQRRVPTAIPAAELPELIALVTRPDADAFAAEAARERLVAAGTAVVPALLEALPAAGASLPAWAEGTLRRVARDPVGDPNAMTAALEKAATTPGARGVLALELLGTCGDVAFLEKQDAAVPAVCDALAASGDRRFAAALLKSASAAGPAQVAALRALGRIKAADELLSMKSAWKPFGDEAREAYARALAMQAREDAIPVLAELAGDANWRVRFRAAVGLGATRSTKAGSAILKLLEDENPAVFRVALYWCTDTLILKPEEYFPKLAARLDVKQPPAIVTPLLHTLILMWDPRCGQWLSRNEDASKRLDYPKLAVWKDASFRRALEGTIAYDDARTATNAMIVLMRMGAELPAERIVAAVRKFPLEQQRWFCERMRDERRPDMAPVFASLWEINDHLVRNFILQYCGTVITPETFAIASKGYDQIPANDDQLRSLAVFTLAAHVKKLDDTAKRAIPLVLELYAKCDWPDGRKGLDTALCRAAGQEPPEKLSNEPADVAARVAMWRKWWDEHK
jgi:hypothetical protein